MCPTTALLKRARLPINPHKPDYIIVENIIISPILL